MFFPEIGSVQLLQPSKNKVGFKISDALNIILTKTLEKWASDWIRYDLRNDNAAFTSRKI